MGDDEDKGNWTAFPSGLNSTDGITIRDYFAGQALMGMLASTPIAVLNQSTVDHKKWAANAYAFANAMVTEREDYDA